MGLGKEKDKEKGVEINGLFQKIDNGSSFWQVRCLLIFHDEQAEQLLLYLAVLCIQHRWRTVHDTKETAFKSHAACPGETALPKGDRHLPYCVSTQHEHTHLCFH